MTKDEKNRISLVLGEYFLRVVKNHDYYLTFKNTFFGKNTLSRRYLSGFGIGDAYNEAMRQFANSAENEFIHHKHEDTVYEYITIFINMVLRTYLEAGGIDPRKLGMIGQELFDLTCYGVFGDKYFTDMEAMNQLKGNMRPPRNDKEAWLMSEFEQRIRNGEKLDFEEFMKERTNVPDEEFWNRSHSLEEMLARNHRMNDEEEYEEEPDDEINELIDDDFFDWDDMPNDGNMHE